MKHTKMKAVVVFLMAIAVVFSMTGCAGISSMIQTFKGELIGNSYTIWGYDNFGSKTLEVHGDKITMDGGVDTSGEATSYIDITIDGEEWNHVGGTLVFAQDGVDMITDFESLGVIETESKSTGLMVVDKFVNNYRNFVGKKSVVLVCSETGTPVCMFQGDKCYSEVPDDLPKTTKISIDGKLVYIHRAKVEIMSAELLGQ